MKHTLELISMNKVWHTEEWYDCECEIRHTPAVAYEFNCDEVKNGIRRHYKLTIYTQNGFCASGYCNSTWGLYDFKEVDKFGTYTHTPKNKRYKFEFDDECADIDCGFFSVDYDGGDEYYPHGFVVADEDFFVADKRFINKPTCFVFFGESGVGKTFLAERVNGMVVYETDSNPTLPNEICADIVVVGNKNNCDYKELVKHISPKYRVVLCGFEEITPNYAFYD